MHPFVLNPEFYYKPILLTKNELANPRIVIQQFYENYQLIEVRKHLHNLLEVAVTSSNALYAEAKERGAVVCFCERIENFVEADLLLTNIHQPLNAFNQLMQIPVHIAIA